MKKYLLLLLFGFISFSTAFAQQDKLYVLGLGLNRYGLAFNFKVQRAEKLQKKWTKGDLLFEVGNILSPREVAVINNAIQGSGVYKYGKINYAWTLRNYYMVRRNLAQRQDKKNVAMNALFGVGVPVAYHWPVYILLQVEDPNSGQNEIVKAKYNPETQPQSQIAGRAPFNTGLKQGTVTPGAGISSAIEFIWGNYRSDVKILTIGARVEAYSQKIPILYRQNMNKSIYSVFYVNFAFGFGKN